MGSPARLDLLGSFSAHPQSHLSIAVVKRTTAKAVLASVLRPEPTSPTEPLGRFSHDALDRCACGLAAVPSIVTLWKNARCCDGANIRRHFYRAGRRSLPKATSWHPPAISPCHQEQRYQNLPGKYIFFDVPGSLSTYSLLSICVAFFVPRILFPSLPLNFASLRLCIHSFSIHDCIVLYHSFDSN